MRTFTAIATTVWLCTATLSGSEQLPRPSLDNVESITRHVVVSVNGGPQVKPIQFDYDPSQGNLRQVLKNTLPDKVAVLKLPSGYDYHLHIDCRAELGSRRLNSLMGFVVSFDGINNPFQLEETEAGLRLPSVAFDWGRYTVTYAGGFNFLMPTVTDYEVTIWQNGTPRRFSTVGNGYNDFTKEGCDLASIRSLVREQHIVSIDAFVVMSNPRWERLELILWEGSQPTVLSYQREPEVSPLSVTVRLVEGQIVISVFGDGAESAIIEQSSDLLSWGTSYSLSRPPTKSSSGEYQFTVHEGTGHWFYRARIDSVLQKR